SSGDHGPFLAGSVGPKIDTMGVPTAAAICSGPVSPETISDARRQIATRSGSDVSGARCATPPDDSMTASAIARSPGPHSTNGTSPRTSLKNDASSPNRSEYHRLLGQAAPGFSRAIGAP